MTPRSRLHSYSIAEMILMVEMEAARINLDNQKCDDAVADYHHFQKHTDHVSRLLCAAESVRGFVKLNRPNLAREHLHSVLP